MSDWFRRDTKNIKTYSKRDTKEGMWHSCPKCRAVIYQNCTQKIIFLFVMNVISILEYLVMIISIY